MNIADSKSNGPMVEEGICVAETSQVTEQLSYGNIKYQIDMLGNKLNIKEICCIFANN